MPSPYELNFLCPCIICQRHIGRHQHRPSFSVVEIAVQITEPSLSATYLLPAGGGGSLAASSGEYSRTLPSPGGGGGTCDTAALAGAGRIPPASLITPVSFAATRTGD